MLLKFITKVESQCDLKTKLTLRYYYSFELKTIRE